MSKTSILRHNKPYRKFPFFYYNANFSSIIRPSSLEPRQEMKIKNSETLHQSPFCFLLIIRPYSIASTLFKEAQVRHQRLSKSFVIIHNFMYNQPGKLQISTKMNECAFDVDVVGWRRLNTFHI